MFEKIQLSVCLSLPHSLRQLMLSNTKVTDEGLLQLSELVRLKILYLDRTTVSDAGIVVVKGRPCWGTLSSMVWWYCSPPPPPPFLVDLCVETWVATFGGATLPPPPHLFFFFFFSFSFLWIFVGIGVATFGGAIRPPLFVLFLV